MYFGHEVAHFPHQLVRLELYTSQQVVCHFLTRLSGPRVEEVDAAAVDNTGELVCTFPE